MHTIKLQVQQKLKLHYYTQQIFKPHTTDMFINTLFTILTTSKCGIEISQTPPALKGCYQQNLLNIMLRAKPWTKLVHLRQNIKQ